MDGVYRAPATRAMVPSPETLAPAASGASNTVPPKQYASLTTYGAWPVDATVMSGRMRPLHALKNTASALVLVTVNRNPRSLAVSVFGVRVTEKSMTGTLSVGDEHAALVHMTAALTSVRPRVRTTAPQQGNTAT